MLKRPLYRVAQQNEESIKYRSTPPPPPTSSTASSTTTEKCPRACAKKVRGFFPPWSLFSSPRTVLRRCSHTALALLGGICLIILCNLHGLSRNPQLSTIVCDCSLSLLSQIPYMAGTPPPPPLAPLIPNVMVLEGG